MAKSGGSFKPGHGRTHGMDGTPTYRSWINMRARCINSNDHAYASYGGRGITVCDRWLNSFENFLADMGVMPPGRSLDRIDNSGSYEPGNCRWATSAEQMRNRRVTKLTPELVRQIMASPLSSPKMADQLGVHSSTIRKVRRGERWKGVA